MKQQTWGDTRPSDRAGPVRRVGLVSVHTSPLEQPGTGDSGGMNVYLTSLARGLARRSVAVDIFTRASSGDLPPTVAFDDGIAVHHVDVGVPAAAKTELASHLCAFYLGMGSHPATARLDVLHGHYWMSGWVGRHLRGRLGIPLVQTFHTLGKVKNETLAPGVKPEPALRLAAEHRIIGDADAVVAATEDEADVLLARYGANPASVHVVPAGVDLTIFNADIDRNAARSALGGGRIILFVGRLQPLKAPDLAVRALAALDQLLPDDGLPTRLVIVGGPSGPASDTAHPRALRRLATDLGVDDRVAVLAPRPQADLAALYRAADVVIVPSASESFGLVALEAQACGTPVVASDVGGLRSLIGSGGTLVAGRTPHAFAAAMAPFLLDARVRATASEAGRRMAKTYSWDATAEATLALYRSLVAGAASAHVEAERRGA